MSKCKVELDRIRSVLLKLGYWIKQENSTGIKFNNGIVLDYSHNSVYPDHRPKEKQDSPFFY